MNEIVQWAALIRDIGLILGVPALIVIGAKLYSQQIEILKARNELLKETQYDRAVSLLESQKRVFLLERETFENQIADLEHLKNEKDATLAELIAGIDGIKASFKTLVENAIDLNEENLEHLLLDMRRETPESDGREQIGSERGQRVL